jgi:hypothetical protein
MLAAMVVALVVLLTTACGPTGPATEQVPPTHTPAALDKGQEPPANTPAATAESQVSPSEAVPPPTVTAGPEEKQEVAEPTVIPEEAPRPGTQAEVMTALARADLARRTALPEESIVASSVEEVIWPDASLGCPQPGMLYAQVLTPGFEILLEAEGQEYEYHTDSDQLVVLCTGQQQVPSDPQADSRPPIFVEMVQAPLVPDSPARMPPADFGPTGVFSYDPSNRLLLVQPSVQILPTTEVLVGLTTAAVPNRPYLPSELFQIPSSQMAPLSVIAIDADSGTLTLAYAGQAFKLRPGQSQSFKQKGEGELAVVQVTTITNHGRLADIGLLPADPGSR